MSVASYTYKFIHGTWSYYIEFQANDATALAYGNGIRGDTVLDGWSRNAISHAHTAASFSYDVGSTPTNILGLLKEVATYDSSKARDTYKDLYNNEIGIKIGQYVRTTLGLSGSAADEAIDDLVMDAYNRGDLIIDQNNDSRVFIAAPAWAGPSENWQTTSAGRDYTNTISFENILMQLASNAFGETLTEWVNSATNWANSIFPLLPLPSGWGGIPAWLASIGAMQNGNGGMQFPAGNGGGIEPLVLDLNGDGAHSTRLGYGAGNLSSTYFDMDNDGFAERTAWVSSGDGLLVMDKNGNGKIDNQNELFGNDATYADGFANLKQYDSNNDNIMNASDTQWANLRVWVDANGDAVTDAGELKTLTQLGITQINLAATTLTNTWDNENEVGATGTFIMNGQTQQVNDIWFRVDQTSSHYMSDVTLNVATLFLPTLKGFGNFKDLHVAMSEDATLLTMVQNFVTNSSTLSFLNNTAFDQQVKNIVFRWAGVDGISSSHTTQGLNTQTMLVLEYLTGYKTSLLNGVPANQNVGVNAISVQSVLFSNVLQEIKAQLLVQTFGGQLFEKGSYNIATGNYAETPVLSSAGIAKIATDLSSISSSQHGTYWLGLNTFLKEIKHPSEYTQSEIDGLNAIWATTSPYGGTWHNFILGSASQPGWYFNGSNLSDNLVGTENGTNTIWGNGGDDYIQGGVYGDNLMGNDGNDILNGKAGQDMLTGGDGDDTYIIEFNSGPDTIDDSSGYDIIKFGEGYDISQFFMRHGTTNNTNMEILFNGQLAATILSYYYPNGQFNLEKVMFADGSFIELDKIANVLNGTAGNDSLSGHNGIDQFHGGLGNDNLNGGGGNDVYVMNIGDGTDTINESSGISDTILMGTGITAGNIRFEKTASLGGDLIIYYSASDKVIITQQFYNEGYPNNYSKQVEFLKLANGTIYDLANGLTFSGTNTDNSVYGTSMNDTLYGLSGNDTLDAAKGNDTLNGGTGNDSLQGGAGDDTYVFNIGDGQDTVQADTSGNDTILMGTGITSTNARFEVSGNDLLIRYGTSDIITLKNHFYDDTNGTNIIDEIETLKFANNSTINLKGTLTFAGTTAAESVYGTKNADILTGLAGDDSLAAYEGNDTLNGGTGNDSLQGGVGDDTYVFNIGDGQDTVYTDTGGNDTILMGTGITSANIRFEKSGNDLFIYYGTSDTIILMNQFYDDTNSTNIIDEIEILKFSNNSTINLKAGLTFTGTSAADTVYGSNMNDILNGLAGDDNLQAGNGNDTLNGGAGNDYLSGQGGTDTLTYTDATAGITVSLAITSAQNTIGSGTDTIVGIENLTGSAYNDTLTGDALANSINGGNGNDTIEGGLGNDVLIGGSGVDTVSYATATSATTVNLSLTSAQNTVSSGTDTISGFENILGSAYNDILTGDGNANTIEGGLGNDTLNGGAGIDTVSYAAATAGVTVNLSVATAQNTIGAGTDTLSNFENIFASAFNDTLTGNSAANTINGGGGNDLIVGGLGADILTGGLGADTFQFLSTGLDANFDRMTDFGTAQGDKIDVKNILVGFDAVTSAITNFIEFTTSGANTIVKVDRDGAGTTYGWQQVAQLDNVTGLTDEAALRASGNLVVA